MISACMVKKRNARPTNQLSLRDLNFSSQKGFLKSPPKTRRNRCGPDIRCSWRVCCANFIHALFKYFVHVGKTSVRRGITILDVGTDIRTFLILYKDDSSAYWSSFLLASMIAPYLVYWSSTYNFGPAVRVLNAFAKRKPQTLRENLSKLYYTLVSLPVLGFILTAILIMYWWISEVVMGVFCKPCHRRARERTEKNATVFEKAQPPRTIMPLMSYDAMRFFTISELFYESFPQVGLQIVIYMSGTSKLYTFQDVLISVLASLLNIFMNVRELRTHAHSYGMRLKDWVLYFMAGSLDTMMKDATPVRLFALSHSLTQCSIMAFDKLYVSESAVRNLCDSLDSLYTPFRKELILPTPSSRYNDVTIERVVKLALSLRHYVWDDQFDFHVSFDRNFFEREVVPLLGKEWLEKMTTARVERRRKLWCPKFVTRFRHAMNQCICFRAGDFLCGTEKNLVEDYVASIMVGKRNTAESECEEYVENYIRWIWPLVSSHDDDRRRHERRRSFGTLMSMRKSDVRGDSVRIAFITCLYLDLEVLSVILSCMRELGKNSNGLYALDNCIQQTVRDDPDLFGGERYRRRTVSYDRNEILYEVRRVFKLSTDGIDFRKVYREQDSIEV